jgi:parallel beta-helix repeat protein
LFIGAPGITLDLAGQTVSAIDDYVVVNEGRANVTIRNGTIHSTSGSIVLKGVSGNLVRDIHTEGLLIGITVEDSHYNRFVHNHVESLSFELVRLDHNVVAHNEVTRYESVLGLRDSDFNRVVDNVVWGGFGTALALTGNHNEVHRNTFLNDSFFVVSLRGANDTEFVANTIGTGYPQLATGAAEIEGSSRNRFARNTVFGLSMGFAVRSGSDNVFKANELSGVPLTRDPYLELVPDGFLIAPAAAGSRLQDNTVRSFDDDGIDADAPGTRLRGNSANDNGDLGIEAVPGVIDLGNNTASGNGNPLQCTNVVCG